MSLASYLLLARFGCPSDINATFLADTDLHFTRSDAGRGTDDDLEQLSGRVVDFYGWVVVLDIKRTANATPRKEAKKNVSKI